MNSIKSQRSRRPANRVSQWVSVGVVIALVGLIAVTLWWRSAGQDNSIFGSDDTGPSESYADLGVVDEESGGGAVSSSDHLATSVGKEVLEEDGNAVDAAIAMANVLAVTEPHASGPGGGGGAMILLPDGSSTFIDFREISDATDASRSDDMAIPGYFAGMEYLQEHHGSFEREELLQPAIDAAEDGVEITQNLHDTFVHSEELFDPSTSPYFTDGKTPDVGSTVELPEAAQTLKGVQNHGASFYYEQVLAEQQPSLQFSQDDLEDHLVVEREPVTGDAYGYTVHAAPAPFSGSSYLEYLQLAEDKALPSVDDASSSDVLEYIEIARTVNASRADVLGDPRFGGSDVQAAAAKTLQPHETVPDTFTDEEFISTTHLSTMDDDGMFVSMTLSLGDYFGNGQLAGGFYMNNSDRFAGQGVNVYEPLKKPRSFMSPAILTGNDETIALGSPGGNKILQILGQTTVAYAQSDSLIDAVSAPRIVNDDTDVLIELYSSQEIETALVENGFDVHYDQPSFHFGAVNLVQLDSDGVAHSYADPRRATKE